MNSSLTHFVSSFGEGVAFHPGALELAPVLLGFCFSSCSFQCNVVCDIKKTNAVVFSLTGICFHLEILI